MNEILNELESQLHSAEESDVEEAAGELAMHYYEERDECALDILIEALGDAPAGKVCAIVSPIGTLGRFAQHRVTALTPLLGSDDRDIRLEVIRALWKLKGEAAAEALEALADDEDDEIQAYALTAVADIRGDESCNQRIRNRPKVMVYGSVPCDDAMYRSGWTLNSYLVPKR